MGAKSPQRRHRRARPNTDELARLLAPTATNAERVKGILALGMPVNDLAELCKTTESGVRHWLGGETEPRPEATVALDYVRAVLKALLDGGMEPQRALRWLMSLDPKHFGAERPFDVLQTTPMRVLTAALEMGLDAEAVA